MRRLLTLTAVIEAATGLILLAYPPLLIRLLLGTEINGVGVIISRIAGAALLAIGIACWVARRESSGIAQRALLIGVLTYNVAATGILSSSRWQLDAIGIALWPAVVAHFVLAVWCVVCLRSKPIG